MTSRAALATLAALTLAAAPGDAQSRPLGTLREQTQQSRSLFDEPGRQSHDRLNAVIDAVNLRYGRKSLYFAGAHEAQAAAPMRIAFQHIPDLEVEAD